MAQKKNVKTKAAARGSSTKAQSTKVIVKKLQAKPLSSKASVPKSASQLKSPAKKTSSPKAAPVAKAKGKATPAPLPTPKAKPKTAAATTAKVAATANNKAPEKTKSPAAAPAAKQNGKAPPIMAAPAKQAAAPVMPVIENGKTVKSVGVAVGTAATHRPAVRAVASAPIALSHAPARAPGAPMAQRPMPASVAKPGSPKLTSAVGANPILDAAAAAAALAANKPVSSRHGFKTGESVVYPAHGVGRIVGIEEQEIAGISLELFVIQFEKDKMTLRVPTSKLASVGMRKLAEDGIVNRAMDTLKGKARIKRTMWSRRAQEYEAKINSGDLIAIAEVVRDLYRSEAQPEQSYSERQLYEAALDRMAREIAAVEKLDERGAIQRITEVLSKSARGRRAAEEAVTATETDIKAA